MYTISIPDAYQSTFLKNISKQSDCRHFSVHIEQDLSSYLSPYLGWCKCGEFEVEIKEEGTPFNCNGNPTYFKRINVHHENIEKLNEFAKNMCYDLTTPDETCEIKVYTGHSRGFFKLNGNICAQHIDKIYVPDTIKKSILNHIDCFLKSKQKYCDFGRFYKTSFLLTGPPGSGKTSIIKAISLKYKRPLYTISFTKQLTDESFIDLATEIKNDSIVLIEDIDAFFVDRQAVDINISFSAFINFLDGALCTGSGIITFITANNPERLDPALIRPGRVDRIVKFEAPKKNEIRCAYKDLTGLENFDEFYAKVPRDISMAGVIEYLFRYSEDPIGNINDLRNQVAMNTMFS